MKWFVNWARRNAAVLIATSALVGVAAPEVKPLVDALGATVSALSTQSPEATDE